MHHALSIDEILRWVFAFAGRGSDEYDSPHENASSPKDSPTLALVCRTWFEPAMDHYWWRVGSLRRLLGLWVHRDLLAKVANLGGTGVSYVSVSPILPTQV